MQKPEEYKANLSTCVVIQGPPGCGKTTLACMFPGVYVADCDMNLRSTIKFMRDQNLPPIVGFDTIDIDEYGKEVPKQLRYTRLTKCLNIAIKDPAVKTIVLDSTTKIAQYLQDEVLKQAGKTEMSIKLWGDYLYLWRNLINYLRLSGKLSAITSHEVAEKDEGDVLRYFLHIPGSIKHELGVYVTDLWRAEASEVAGKMVYNVRTNPTQKFLLKNTLGLPTTFKAEPKVVQDYLKQLATAVAAPTESIKDASVETTKLTT